MRNLGADHNSSANVVRPQIFGKMYFLVTVAFTWKHFFKSWIWSILVIFFEFMKLNYLCSVLMRCVYSSGASLRRKWHTLWINWTLRTCELSCIYIYTYLIWLHDYFLGLTWIVLSFWKVQSSVRKVALLNGKVCLQLLTKK